jgi:internalin A
MSLIQGKLRSTKPALIRRANLLAGRPASRTDPCEPQLKCYASYAWGDSTPEGQDRDMKVEGLCRRAEDSGVEIIRDKSALKAGDKISDFMRRLGAGDRIFVILSDKYIRSLYCMTELSEVWRNCRHDEGEFGRRIRSFVMPCASISKLSDRVAYGAYWKAEHDKVEKIIQVHGSSILGENGSIQHQITSRIAGETIDLLTQFADVVTPRDFEDFLQYGFMGL